MFEVSGGVQAMSSAITIKGTRDGLLVALGAGEIDHILTELQSFIAHQECFFRGGQVVLQFGERDLTSRDVMRAMGILERYGVLVRAILSRDSNALSKAISDQSTESTEQDEAMSEAQDELAAQTPQVSQDSSGLIVKRTLRSGQSVQHAGHIVIIGDVNSGAEVIAEGDIIVWGNLRGIVHAGAAGDEERCICALALSPTQLRIGNRIARPPENRSSRKRFGPERAFVSDGQIVAEEWK
jgi:septum site-determining protein MinC